MMRIRETIVVEGRDDSARIREAVDAPVIETHGYGIAKETWELLEKAYQTTGLVILTDPDHAGEEIRRRIRERFPEAKEAFLPRDKAERKGDIGVENAAPEALRQALEKARVCRVEETEEIFSMEDLRLAGMAGGPGAAERRRIAGERLGIGYGNAGSFLKKLNRYGIDRKEWEDALKDEA